MRRRESDGQLVPDPGETSIIRELVEFFVESGGRVKATAAALNKRGRRTRRGPWSDTAVNRLLRNPALAQMVPDELWRRCEGMLSGPTTLDSPPRRSVQPLSGITHCRCGSKMYLRDAGPSGKYVCRECRAKITQGALESLFIKTLESIALDADEIVDALEDNPRAAELTRSLGGRQVRVSEVWPLLNRASRCQLVDLLVARIVVSADEVSVILADSTDSEGGIEPLAPNLLPFSHGSTSPSGQATSPSSGNDPDHLPPMLTIEEAAAVLRTTVKAVYSRIDRGQLPGVKRVGRRLLIQRDELLGWLGESRASSPEERRP